MPRLLAALRIVLGSLMFAAVTINLANIVGRYGFSKPVFWAEEAMVFIQIWCVIIGAALVSYEHAHLRMDAFEHLVPRRFKRWLDAITGLVMVVVALTIAWVSVGIVNGMINNDVRSVALELPMAVPYGILPIGFALIALFAALRLIKLVRGHEAKQAPSGEELPKFGV